MPEAPVAAVQKLLARTGLSMNDVAVVKNHNPFAVNDAIFAKVLGYDWRNMNNTGSSLVSGHTKAPTQTRVLIEGLEEAADLGGGSVLVFGSTAWAPARWSTTPRSLRSGWMSYRRASPRPNGSATASGLSTNSGRGVTSSMCTRSSASARRARTASSAATPPPTIVTRVLSSAM